jgi:hypothetical protein
MPSIYDVMLTRGDGTPYFPAYAWPGGYPLIYICADGAICCAACATKTLWDTFPDYRPALVDVFYEGGPETCSVCHAVLESADGDSEEDVC